MNGFIKKSVAGSCLALTLILLIGCDHYRDLVDPCWPQRYTSIAMHSVREMAHAQTDRGHMLEQTMWNWYFAPDPKTGGPSDVLNGAGQEVLRRIARTLPAPDGQLFLQNAQDVPYVDGLPAAKLIAQREALNQRRIAAIQRFMATQMSTGGNVYQVAVHDFVPTGVPSHWPVNAIEGTIETNIKGGIQQKIQPPTYSTK